MEIISLGVLHNTQSLNFCPSSAVARNIPFAALLWNPMAVILDLWLCAEDILVNAFLPWITWNGLKIDTVPSSIPPAKRPNGHVFEPNEPYTFGHGQTLKRIVLSLVDITW